MRALLAVLAAVNPAAVAVAVGPQKRPVVLAVAGAIAWALATFAAGTSGAVLDALDVSPGTFRIAAGAVLGIVGGWWVAAGGRRVDDSGTGWGQLGVPFLVPVLVTPQLAMVSISAGVDHGTVVVSAAAAVSLALAVAAGVAGGQRMAWQAGARFVGALAVAVALALVVDGVQTV